MEQDVLAYSYISFILHFILHLYMLILCHFYLSDIVLIIGS